MLTGSIVALITPMRADGSVNYEQLQALVEWHIANGTDAIVAVGTTGESATLSVDEHLKVVETVIKTANKPVYDYLKPDYVLFLMRMPNLAYVRKEYSLP